MQEGMRNKLLQKLLDFIQQYPDEQMGEEGDESIEMPENAKPKGKIEMMAIEAKPKGDLKDIMKGC